ncbi:MAG: pyridoxamine 5'-phosphate oxidase family protein [Anaerolineae bacterium]|nr:pyridoxamine 5'-phosphate oxidase family protein [Anaerolineae bacterium]
MKATPPLSDELRTILLNFLASQSTLALGTAGDSDGRPQVAPVFFVNDESFNLYWVSNPHTRHSVNLAAWNDVAGAVYTDTWEMAAIKGVQLEGDAKIVTDDDERQRALGLYMNKFAFVAKMQQEHPEAMQQGAVYVLRPRWGRWVDNAQGFGYQQEFSLVSPNDSG